MARLAIFKLITAVVVAILCYVYAPFHPLPAILISSVGLAITFFGMNLHFPVPITAHTDYDRSLSRQPVRPSIRRRILHQL